MLESIYVKNVALIDEAELSFGEGLNILTGETGAGKSILLSAVKLALGGKADKSLIRSGEESAFVQLVFSLTDKDVKKTEEFEDIPLDENMLILQRRVFPGKSICKINGVSVPLHTMQEIAGMFIDMHGQREHMSLLKKDRQLFLIDLYGGEDIGKKKEELIKIYRALKENENLLNESDRDPEELKREIDFLKFEADEIDKAEILSNEDEELEKRFDILCNAEKIRSALNNVISLLQDESGRGAINILSNLMGELDSVACFDEGINDIGEIIKNAEELLSEARGMADGKLEYGNSDPGELNAVTERLNLINHLKDKYGGSIDGIYSHLNEINEKLDKLLRLGEDKDNLRKENERLTGEYDRAAEKLYELRMAAAGEFSAEMKNALNGLNFSSCEFEASLKHDPERRTENGSDECIFEISLNAGEEKRPLDRIASGGELSRIMLALKTVFADRDETQTLVFDEIDAGISGKTAWMVGEKLAILRKRHQVICITHLPQIAAMADCHYEISKQTENDRTNTSVRELDRDEMVNEIGRLLGAGEMSESALTNARELKQKADEVKSKI